MFVEIKTFQVKLGFAQTMVERFSKKSVAIQGLVKLEILLGKSNHEAESVLVVTTWESEAVFRAWKKSPEHIAGHKNNPERPDFVLQVQVATYTVAISKEIQENK